MQTVPIFYEGEISNSHPNTFIVKTESLFAHLSGKLISNNFSGVKIDFRFHKKSEQLALMAISSSNELILRCSQKEEKR